MQALYNATTHAAYTWDFQLHSIWKITYSFATYCTRENFGRGKLANSVNCELFAKIFLTHIHRYTENVFGICTDCSLFAKIFLANSFYLYGLPNFLFAKFTVYGNFQKAV